MAEAGKKGLVGKRGRPRRWVCIALVVAMLPLMLSCYGRFPLTKAVYNMNGAMSTPEVRKGVLESVVMWVFIIVPVYGVAMVADVVIFNLVEFWTGEPLQIGSAGEADGHSVALEPSADGSEAVLTASKDGEVVTTVRFVKVSETLCEVRDADGRLAGMAVRTPGGDMELTDGDGRVVSRISGGQLAALHEF